MAQFLLYISLSYTWGHNFAVEAGPEIWVERPQYAVTWVQVAPALIKYDSSDREIEFESRLNAWLQRPAAPYTIAPK